MRTRTGTTIKIAAVVWTCVVATGRLHATESQDPTAHFRQAVANYVYIHEEVAQTLPLLEVSVDPYKVQETIDALGTAIALARLDAREGDIFTPEVAAHFKMIIKEVIRVRGGDVADLIEDLNDEVTGMPKPVVNGWFPWDLASLTPPAVLAALPPLPFVLQYRFVGRDLVLVDADAELVVDVLREALPPVRATLRT